MFPSYDEAMGKFKASGSKDPQIVASVAGGLRNIPKIARIASFIMMIPCIAATLLIIGAIIGIPGLIVLGIVVSKAGSSLAAIDKAEQDYLASA